MHALGQLVTSLMDGRGWRQADLVRASGLTRAHISDLVSPAKERLGRMPDDRTLDRLAAAFPEVGRPTFVLKAAEAMGVPVGEIVAVEPDYDSLTNEALLAILAKRLKQGGQDEGQQPEAEKSPPGGGGVVSFAEEKRRKMIEQSQMIDRAAYKPGEAEEPRKEDDQ